MPTVGQDDVGSIPVEPALLLVYAAEGNGQIFRIATLASAVQISVAMSDNYLCDDSVYTRYVVYRTAISIVVYC